MYLNVARPCVKCPHAQADNGCAIYGNQDVACDLYKKWDKSKKHAYAIKYSLALEFHQNEVNEKPGEQFDLEKSTKSLNEVLKHKLRPTEWAVYKWIYIDNKPQDELAKQMGFRTSEKNRAAGYKSIKNIQNAIYGKAKAILAEGDVDI